MHTSTILRPEHFRYRLTDAGGAREATFAQALPHYHPQDRAAVAWDSLHEALFACAPALLALTTAFYEDLRHRCGTQGFFDYPQHFAVMAGPGEAAVFAGSQAWGMLDVWPASKWKVSSHSPAAVIQALFDLQINRILWPAAWWEDARSPIADSPGVPDHVRRTLATTLKQVWLYAPFPPATEATVAVAGDAAMEQVIDGVIDHLPDADAATRATMKSARRRRLAEGRAGAVYGVVTAEAFLRRYAGVFAAA